MNIFISAFEVTVLITAVFTFFGVSIFVLFQYFLHQKKIRNEIDEILLNHAKYIKKEFDEHKEEYLLQQKKLEEEIEYTVNLLERYEEIAKILEKHGMYFNSLHDKLTKLEKDIKWRDGKIANLNKKIKRLKEENGKSPYNN